MRVCVRCACACVPLAALAVFCLCACVCARLLVAVACWRLWCFLCALLAPAFILACLSLHGCVFPRAAIGSLINLVCCWPCLSGRLPGSCRPAFCSVVCWLACSAFLCSGCCLLGWLCCLLCLLACSCAAQVVGSPQVGVVRPADVSSRSGAYALGRKTLRSQVDWLPHYCCPRGVRLTTSISASAIADGLDVPPRVPQPPKSACFLARRLGV